MLQNNIISFSSFIIILHSCLNQRVASFNHLSRTTLYGRGHPMDQNVSLIQPIGLSLTRKDLSQTSSSCQDLRADGSVSLDA